MKDLRREQKDQKLLPSTSYYIKKFSLARTWKLFKYALLLTGAYLVIFEPEVVGAVLGRWIHDFFGTLWKEAKF